MAKRARSQEAQNDGNISEALDQLSCELLGEALDMLADGREILAVASVMDASDQRLTCAFEEDSPELCLSAAREWVRSGGKASGAASKAGSPVVGKAQCYAIAYEGAIAAEEGAADSSYHDALILEFGERGADTAYSAYVLVDNVGGGRAFRYTDPEPAGELPCLL